MFVVSFSGAVRRPTQLITQTALHRKRMITKSVNKMRLSGRRRKPAILHVLQGTLDSTHKGREYEPQAEGPLGEAPEDFSAEERKEWEFVRANSPAKMLATLDRRALIAWCRSCVAYDQASAQLKKHGMLIKNASGIPVKSPLIGIVNDQLRHIRVLAEQLGFTPSGRARLQAPHHDDDDAEWKTLKRQSAQNSRKKA
jgi:P27 family predicted phage terminase small subunit